MAAAHFVFELRRNITLEGDLQLARRELEAFLSPVDNRPRLAPLPGSDLQHSVPRPVGQQAFQAQGPLDLLPHLLRRPAFVQRIYCTTPDTAAARDLLAQHERVLSFRAADGLLYIEALPHYALFEYAEVIARQGGTARTVKHNLDLLLETLTGRSDTARGRALMERALGASVTTGLLSHDIHYYKAKFFPRMARAMLNMAAQQAGGSPPRVLDPFVGSGTTLLEAALLGLPSVGTDLDPLSVLISRTKLGVLGLESSFLADETARAAELLAARHTGQQSMFAQPASNGHEPLRFPDWLLKNRAMTPEAAAQLADEIAAVQAAAAACHPAARDLYRVLMSDAITRRVRMRFLGTGVGRFSLTFSRTPLAELFLRSLRRYVGVAAAWEWLRDLLDLRLAPAEVLAGDAREPAPGGPFDLIVTSPPYLPASSGRESYARARAPALLALGLAATDDVDALADDAVGSMDDETAAGTLSEQGAALVNWLQTDPLRAIKAGPTARYLLDMRRSFGQMYAALRPGGAAVVVSGRQSTFYRYSTREVLYTVPIAEMLADEAVQAGLEVQELLHVQLRKRNSNARPRSLDDYDETLILLRRP